MPTATAFAVHLFTASGAAVAFCALAAAIERDFTATFAWLGLALVIDGVDGTLARAADVAHKAVRFDGDVLDLVVDFLTYVIVPLVAVWRADLLPAALGTPVCALVALASALYFANREMKTSDHWFRGFPALWNVAALYLFVFQPGPALCASILVLLAALMFAPVAFVHPLRVAKWRATTVLVTLVWFASAAQAVAQGLDADWLARAGLAFSAVYFIALMLWRARARLVQ